MPVRAGGVVQFVTAVGLEYSSLHLDVPNMKHRFGKIGAFLEYVVR